MRRRVFGFISLLSLLLCVAAAALWFLGRGRAMGWYFRPSAAIHIPPPDPSLPDQSPLPEPINTKCHQVVSD